MAAIVKWRMLAVCVITLALNVDRVRSSAEVMKKMTLSFTKALEQCKNELNLGDQIMQDFYNFWKEDYELLNKDMGCAIMCMASKSDLVSGENKLHHRNAHEFAKNHGADDDMAKEVVSIINDCEIKHDGITDDCIMILEIAKCFRTRIHGLKWAPNMEIVLEEIMTEV